MMIEVTKDVFDEFFWNHTTGTMMEHNVGDIEYYYYDLPTGDDLGLMIVPDPDSTLDREYYLNDKYYNVKPKKSKRISDWNFED